MLGQKLEIETQKFLNNFAAALETVGGQRVANIFQEDS